MADTIIALPKYGVGDGSSVPIKAVDLLDGTYAIAASTGTVSGIFVAFPLSTGGAGELVKMATVDLLDGTYALKVTE